MKLKPGAKFKARKPRMMHPEASHCSFHREQQCRVFWDGKHKRYILRVTKDKRPRTKQCFHCKGWCALSPVIRGKELVVAHGEKNFTMSDELVESGVLDDEFTYHSGMVLP